MPCLTEGSYAREFLDPNPQLRVLQHIVCPHLLMWNTVQIQNLYDSAGKTTLWQLGRALHKKDKRRGINDLLDLYAGFRGEKSM